MVTSLGTLSIPHWVIIFYSIFDDMAVVPVGMNSTINVIIGIVPSPGINSSAANLVP